MKVRGKWMGGGMGKRNKYRWRASKQATALELKTS